MNLAAWAQGSRAAATINSKDGEPNCDRGLGGGLGVFAGFVVLAVEKVVSRCSDGTVYKAGARPLQKGDL